MRRRDFIVGIGGVAWPLAARAQQPSLPVIGYLDPTSADATRLIVAEFRQGLKEAGYVEDQNVAIEFRWANNQPDLLPKLAADLVARKVAVIVASGASSGALAAKAATSTIPIVFVGGADPVKRGLIASLNQPGGNLTGITGILNELAGKRLDLIRRLVPQATTLGYLAGYQSDTDVELANDLLQSERASGRELIILNCRSDSDFEPAFETLVKRHAGALVVSAFPIAFNNRPKILALAARHKIPAIYAQSLYTVDGGLMSYAPVGIMFQAAFNYVARILKGAKPADLPVQEPTRFALVINLKTARALDLTVPETLLAIADMVIE
jgi:putative tryptophan/tyrosine transport system substrate-binding protein